MRNFNPSIYSVVSLIFQVQSMIKTVAHLQVSNSNCKMYKLTFNSFELRRNRHRNHCKKFLYYADTQNMISRIIHTRELTSIYSLTSQISKTKTSLFIYPNSRTYPHLKEKTFSKASNSYHNYKDERNLEIIENNTIQKNNTNNSIIQNVYPFCISSPTEETDDRKTFEEDKSTSALGLHRNVPGQI